MTIKYIITLSKEFWAIQQEFNLDNKACVLYFFLMKEFVKRGYKEMDFNKEFIEENTGIDKGEVREVMNSLQKAKLITFGHYFQYEGVTVPMKLKRK